jgi:VanZ family protein
MTETGNSRNKRFLSLICIAIIIAILFAGLWPFNFWPKNEVTWIHGQNGIHFGRHAIAYSTDSFYGPQGIIRPGGPVSIEFVVRPTKEPDHSISRIITLYGGGSHQYFTLAQWKSYLIIRTASLGNDLTHDFRETGAGNVFFKNISKHLVITSHNENTKIYADGRMMKLTRNFPILPPDSVATGKLVFGNSPEGHGPWRGDLFFLAAYNRELSAEEVSQHFQDWITRGTPTWLPGKIPTLLYRFDEGTGTTSRNHGGSRCDLSIPPTFHVLKNNILRPPWKEEHFRRSFIQDVLLNILGFLPLGFFFAARLRSVGRLSSKHQAFLAAILGVSISLTIELLQNYIPTRTSSLTDVACNLMGAIFGACLFPMVPRIFHRDNLWHK